VVSVDDVTADALTLSTRIEAENERQQKLDLKIERRLASADLSDSRLQILGFHTKDGPSLPGTTTLGPSLLVMRELRTTGRAAYSVRNFTHLSTSTGTLIRTGEAAVPFTVLLNGRRVELPAMRVTGQLAYSGNVRPWEFYLLDHPVLPLTLRFAVGGVGQSFPFEPEVTREIVKIDFPDLQRQASVVESGLTRECRAEVPGLYFDFNRATIDARSKPALQSMADLLKRHPWSVTVEGHTDNVGTDPYNQDLSERRAAAVKDALVRDYGIAAARLSSAGFAARRPRETNETIAGRARNRRVELVRDCSKS
jgi:outer membrane protein OmpA-like peptidoglycan-associated protein